jgi:hypothetical protein
MSHADDDLVFVATFEKEKSADPSWFTSRRTGPPFIGMLRFAGVYTIFASVAGASASRPTPAAAAA